MTAPPDTAPGTLRDAFGPLLHIDRRDVTGLTWTKRRCRMWLTALKKRRKYLPRGCGYTPEEGQLIEALARLDDATTRLLTMSDPGAHTKFDR